MAQVMDKINNMMLITGDDGRITWCNQAFNTFTEFSSEETIGKSPGELLSGIRTDADTIRR